MAFFGIFDGTLQSVFRIGKTPNRSAIRSNFAKVEISNDGEITWNPVAVRFSSPEVFTVDSTIISSKQIILSVTPFPDSEFVVWSGGPLLSGSSYDYTISGNIITFTDELVSRFTIGDRIFVRYQKI